MAVNNASVPLLGVPGNWEELEHSFAALQIWLGTLAQNVGNIGRAATGAASAAADLIRSRTLANAITETGAFAAADAGAIYFITDYQHLVRWSGTAWAFMDGGNRYFSLHQNAPGTGWALCDGSVVTFMRAAAVLDTATFTTPNLSGNRTWYNSIAAYTGNLEAATATALSGSTASESAHTHLVSGNTGIPDTNVSAEAFVLNGPVQPGAASHTHSVSITSGAGSAHSHTVGTLAADAAARPPTIGMLPYFRL